MSTQPRLRPAARTHPTALSDLFTVVWWDQRGAGLSYHPDIPPETMTVEQLIDDVTEVTDHLRVWSGQGKVHLLGHSWGSFLGIQAAARTPQLFHSYIGMAQVTSQLESEMLAYDYMLAEYRRRHDTRMVRALEAAPVTRAGGTPPAYLALRDKAMHRLGVGTMHDMDSVITGIFLPSLRFRDYTLREKWNLWRGRSFSRSFGLWDELLATDLRETVPELDVPVHFLCGRHDYTCSTALAKEYFDCLDAPTKRFHLFDESAHSPIFEEPQRAHDVFRDHVL